MGQGTSIADRRQGRRWRFADIVLDEASWTLSVAGRRVPIEAKPLELLHELLLHAGDVVTKGELLDAIWPEVSVVEASLPTAVSKLRRALGDDNGHPPVVETVPRVGYRLAVPVVVESGPADVAPGIPATGANRARPRLSRSIAWLAFGGLGALAAVGVVAVPRALAPPTPPLPVTRQDVLAALRALDIARIHNLVNRGWNPAVPLTPTGDAAIGLALEACEWNPGHDRRQLMLVVRTLIDNGAILTHRNAFGDTPYSIAKAPRYCGPDHPATRLLRAMCYNGLNAPGDRCLATYELARRKKPASAKS